MTSSTLRLSGRYWRSVWISGCLLQTLTRLIVAVQDAFRTYHALPASEQVDLRLSTSSWRAEHVTRYRHLARWSLSRTRTVSHNPLVGTITDLSSLPPASNSSSKGHASSSAATTAASGSSSAAVPSAAATVAAGERLLSSVIAYSTHTRTSILTNALAGRPRKASRETLQREFNAGLLGEWEIRDGDAGGGAIADAEGPVQRTFTLGSLSIWASPWAAIKIQRSTSGEPYVDDLHAGRILALAGATSAVSARASEDADVPFVALLSHTELVIKRVGMRDITDPKASRAPIGTAPSSSFFPPDRVAFALRASSDEGAASSRAEHSGSDALFDALARGARPLKLALRVIGPTSPPPSPTSELAQGPRGHVLAKLDPNVELEDERPPAAAAYIAIALDDSTVFVAHFAGGASVAWARIQMPTTVHVSQARLVTLRVAEMRGRAVQSLTSGEEPRRCGVLVRYEGEATCSRLDVTLKETVTSAAALAVARPPDLVTVFAPQGEQGDNGERASAITALLCDFQEDIASEDKRGLRRVIAGDAAGGVRAWRWDGLYADDEASSSSRRVVGPDVVFDQGVSVGTPNRTTALACTPALILAGFSDGTVRAYDRLIRTVNASTAATTSSPLVRTFRDRSVPRRAALRTLTSDLAVSCILTDKRAAAFVASSGERILAWRAGDVIDDFMPGSASARRGKSRASAGGGGKSTTRRGSTYDAEEINAQVHDTLSLLDAESQARVRELARDSEFTNDFGVPSGLHGLSEHELTALVLMISAEEQQCKERLELEFGLPTDDTPDESFEDDSAGLSFAMDGLDLGAAVGTSTSAQAASTSRAFGNRYHDDQSGDDDGPDDYDVAYDRRRQQSGSGAGMLSPYSRSPYSHSSPLAGSPMGNGGLSSSQRGSTKIQVSPRLLPVSSGSWGSPSASAPVTLPQPADLALESDVVWPSVGSLPRSVTSTPRLVASSQPPSMPSSPPLLPTVSRAASSNSPTVGTPPSAWQRTPSSARAASGSGARWSDVAAAGRGNAPTGIGALLRSPVATPSSPVPMLDEDEELRYVLELSKVEHDSMLDH